MAGYSGRLEKFFTIEDLQAIERAFNVSVFKFIRLLFINETYKV